MLRRRPPPLRGPVAGGSWKDEWRRAPPYLRVAVVGLVAASGLYVASHVEKMPLTGRRRVMFLSPLSEQRLGERAYLEIMQSERVLPATHPMTRAVRRVGSKIVEQASAAGQTPMAWQFHVLEADEPNAFCLPGGKVFVNSGLFKVLNGEDALAAVLFHEAAHGLARHGAEKISFSLLLYGLLGLFVPDYGALSDLLVKVAADLPFSRKLELEADAIGLRLMARACYDPRAAIQMNTALGAQQSHSPPKYLSTHPPSHERVDALRRDLKDAVEIYKAGGCVGKRRAFSQAARPVTPALDNNGQDHARKRRKPVAAVLQTRPHAAPSGQRLARWDSIADKVNGECNTEVFTSTAAVMQRAAFLLKVYRHADHALRRDLTPQLLVNVQLYDEELMCSGPTAAAPTVETREYDEIGDTDQVSSDSQPRRSSKRLQHAKRVVSSAGFASSEGDDRGYGCSEHCGSLLAYVDRFWIEERERRAEEDRRRADAQLASERAAMELRRVLEAADRVATEREIERLRGLAGVSASTTWPAVGRRPSPNSFKRSPSMR